MKTKIKQLVDDISTLQEQLLSMPDDLLLAIDPRDNESLKRGLEFIASFNDEFATFSKSASSIEKLLTSYFEVTTEEEDVVAETVQNKQVVKSLDKSKPVALESDFTFKRPYGIIFNGMAYTDIKTWKTLYVKVLQELYQIDPGKFVQMADAPKFISKRGNPMFSRKLNKLRVAAELPAGVNAEINLSANGIRDNLITVIQHFGMKTKEIKVYLREDRNPRR